MLVHKSIQQIAVAVILLAFTAIVQAAIDPQISVSKELVLEEYQLYDCSLGTVQVDSLQRGKVSAQFSFDGKDYTMEIWPYSVRADGFKLKVQDEQGNLVETDPEPIATYRGFLRDHGDSSLVAVSVLDNGICGVFQLDKEWYVIEPVGDATPDGTLPVHIVYQESDLIEDYEHTCGTNASHYIFKDNDLLIYDLDTAGKGTRDVFSLCQIAIDSDYGLYADNNFSIPDTQADIENIMNAIAAQYENDLQITYEITELVVRTSSGSDPYYNISSAETMLTTFRSLWNSSYTGVTRDTAHLFTGQNLDSGVLGLAYVGVMCESNVAYGLSWSTYTGTFARRVNVSAHELGHNWNAGHCDESGDNNYQYGCCGDGFTMCSYAVSNPIGEFCSASISVISAYRNYLGCLGSVVDALDLPFDDTFPSSSLDSSKWRYVDGASSSTAASNEPSSPYSLRLSGTSEIRSNHILMAADSNAGGVFSYYYQQSGNEAGEDLFVEYYNSNMNWVELEHIEAGANMTTFQYREIQLPEDAVHDLFRFRFRTVANSTTDRWYIDDVHIEGCQGESILTQPVNANACLGGDATFTTSATGSPSYQWYEDGSPMVDGGNISGATTSSLTISSIDESDIASYQCKISNDCGPVWTSSVTVSINPPPTVLTHPQNLEVCRGEIASLNSAFSSPTPITYRWEKDGVILDGEDRYYITIQSTELSDAGIYRCEATNECGSTWTNTAVLTILEAPVVITQPEDTCAELGESASFTMEIDGTPPYYFIWYHNGVSIPSSNNQVLTITNVDESDAGEYYALFVSYSATSCEVMTETATLQVGNCPSVPVCNHAVPGDIDDDGDVDLADFALFQECFGTDMAYVDGCECANLDTSNYDIDLADYVLFEATITGP